MAIQTNIDVSVFNIIRYFLLNIVLDLIVRRSLDSFEHFRRRLSLYHGRSVSMSRLRLDRYNLLGTIKSTHVLPAAALFVITVIAYAVEVGLEYAVDSRAIRYPTCGNITRVQYDTGVCSLDRIFTDQNAGNMAFIAEQCVRFEDGRYRFYHPVWTREADGREALLCEPVEQNKLYQGEGVYGARFASEGAVEMEAFVEALSNNAYKSMGDFWHSLIVVNVTSADFFQWKTFSTPSAQFSIAFFVKDIPDTDVQCFGFTSGRQGQSNVMLQLVGCVNGFSENGSLVITSGTSFVDVAAEGEANGSGEWSTQVAFEIRTRIPHYFRGVALEGSTSQANATAYAGFFLALYRRT